MTTHCFPNQSALHSVEQALDILLSYAKPSADIVDVPIEKSLGFVITQAIVSQVDIPPKDNTSMDGYALNSADFTNKPLTISTRICAGDIAKPLVKNTAVRIFTGAQIPKGADCVVVQEECEEANGCVEIFSLPITGENIRKQGEDIQKGAIILEKGSKIRAQEIGLLASIGQKTVSVYAKLKVVILSTGNEIINPGQGLKQGQIYNSNRYTLLGLLANMAVEVFDFGIIKDDFNVTKTNLLAASKQADLIISTGGVSVGEEDHIKTALKDIGQLMMWKVRMKPGKPLAFGKIGQAFFMGLPGNPVSTFAIFNLFVRPFMAKLGGALNYKHNQYFLEADFDWLIKGNRRQYLRAKLVGEKVIIYPNQSSGVLSSVVWATGFCCILENTIVKKGDKVMYIPFE